MSLGRNAAGWGGVGWGQNVIGLEGHSEFGEE